MDNLDKEKILGISKILKGFFVPKEEWSGITADAVAEIILEEIQSYE